LVSIKILYQTPGNFIGNKAARGDQMRRIIGVEPGEGEPIYCILETDDLYTHAMVQPDGRVELPVCRGRFYKASVYSHDYKSFSAIYGRSDPSCRFLVEPIPVSEDDTLAPDDLQRLYSIAHKKQSFEGQGNSKDKG
jgi:hypothetical protein